MLTWPTELPNPDADAFKIVFADTVQRTQMDKGFVRARPTAKIAPTAIECVWRLSGPESRLLRDFFRYALRQGSDSFLFPCPMDDGYHTQRVLFTEPPEFQYVDPGEWTATGKLLIQEDFGPSQWVELFADATHQDDVNSPISVIELPVAYKFDRVDVFVRVAPDSSVSDVLRVGWNDEDGTPHHTALVVDLDLQVADGTHIALDSTGAHPPVGSQMGDWKYDTEDPSEFPRTLVVKWISNDEGAGDPPTKGDILVICHQAISEF